MQTILGAPLCEIAVRAWGSDSFGERRLRLAGDAELDLDLPALGGAGPLGLPSVLSTACPTPSLKIRLDPSGKRVATAVQAPLVDLVTFSFEGEPASGARAANVLPSASEVVAAAQADVEAGAADLMHLAVMLPASEEGRAALDEALAALAQRAAEREGSLVLVGTGSFAAAQGALSLDNVDTHDEVHGAVLEGRSASRRRTTRPWRVGCEGGGEAAAGEPLARRARPLSPRRGRAQ